MKKKNIKLKQITYYIFFLLITIAKVLDYSADNWELQLIAIIAFLFVLISILGDEYSKTELIKIIFAGTIGIFTFLSSSKEGFLFSVIAIVAVKNLSIEKIIRIYYKVSITFFIFMIIASLGGIKENKVVDVIRFNGSEWTTITRQTLGYSHPNILFLHFFIILAVYVYINYKNMDIYKHIFIFLISYVFFLVSGSRTGFIISVLFILLSLLFKYFSLMSKSIFRKILPYSTFACASFSIIISVMYGKGYKIAQYLDSFMTGRVQLSYKFMEKYSIKLFGQRIDAGNNINGEYMNLDNSYVNLLLAYGVIAFLFYIYLMYKVTKKMILLNCEREVLLIVIFSIYGISETFLPNIFLNISLIFLSDIFYNNISKAQLEEQKA